jgi:hypothetical protein
MSFTKGSSDEEVDVDADADEDADKDANDDGGGTKEFMVGL